MSLPFLIKDRREFIREQSAVCLYNLRMTNWTLRNIQQNKCLVVNISNPKSKKIASNGEVRAHVPRDLERKKKSFLDWLNHYSKIISKSIETAGTLMVT